MHKLLKIVKLSCFEFHIKSMTSGQLRFQIKHSLLDVCRIYTIQTIIAFVNTQLTYTWPRFYLKFMSQYVLLQICTKLNRKVVYKRLMNYLFM